MTDLVSFTLVPLMLLRKRIGALLEGKRRRVRVLSGEIQFIKSKEARRWWVLSVSVCINTEGRSSALCYFIQPSRSPPQLHSTYKHKHSIINSNSTILLLLNNLRDELLISAIVSCSDLWALFRLLYFLFHSEIDGSPALKPH